MKSKTKQCCAASVKWRGVLGRSLVLYSFLFLGASAFSGDHQQPSDVPIKELYLCPTNVPMEAPDALALPTQTPPTCEDIEGNRLKWFKHPFPAGTLTNILLTIATNDAAKAQELRHRADTNDASAQRLLGYWYELHTNFDEAISWYEKASKQGDRVSKIMMVSVHKIQENLFKANMGDPNAQWFLGESYLSRGYIGEATKWFEGAANQLHGKSMKRVEEIQKFREQVLRIQKCQAPPSTSISNEVAIMERQNFDQDCASVGRFIGRDAGNMPEAAEWCLLASVIDSTNALDNAREFEQGKTFFSILVALDKTAISGGLDARAVMGAIAAKGRIVDSVATQWLKQAAESGRPFAQVALAEAYEDGAIMPKNMADALKWFIAAAEPRTNHDQVAEIRVKVGVMLRDGLAGTANPREALKWFIRAPDVSDGDVGKGGALFLLSTIYREGKLTPSDPQESQRWLVKAAEAGDELAKCFLRQSPENGDTGNCLNTNAFRDVLGRPAPTLIRTEVRKWVFKEATAGNPLAQCALGLGLTRESYWDAPRRCEPFSSWKTLPRDVSDKYERGIHWLILAAEQGELKAQIELGKLYEDGWGLRPDFSNAAKWYERAAEQGDTRSARHLASFFRAGRGVPRSGREAWRWLLVAASDGLAQTALGDMARDGEGVPQDLVEAYAWFNLSASDGYLYGQQERDKLTRVLSPEQIREGQERSVRLSQRIHKSKRKADQPRSEELKATGTGFFVTTNGVLITSAHVVDTASRIVVRHFGHTLDAQIIRTDRANDVAVLKVNGTFVPLAIASSKAARLGDSVLTVGYPNTQVQGIEPKLTRGEINSLAGIHDDPRYFQISVPVQPGNSGGALIDSHGNAVGIIMSRLADTETLEATGSLPQNVNYALKSSFLEALLENVPYSSSAPSNISARVSMEQITQSALEATVLLLVY